MISASHNVFYDNGIKIINGKGHKLESEVEEKIEAYIDGEFGEIPYCLLYTSFCYTDPKKEKRNCRKSLHSIYNTCYRTWNLLCGNYDRGIK